MQSTSCEMPSWMKHKLDEAQAGIKIVGRDINKISVVRYADDTTLMAESEETKEPLDESERGE